MNLQYILENDEPKPCDDIVKWAQFMGSSDRFIKKTKITNDIVISSVFLGLDHSFFSKEPVLWETMIFGGPEDGQQERYSSKENMLKRHEELVNIAKQKFNAE